MEDLQTKIKELSDKDCLSLFIDLVKDRVQLRIGYSQDETGLLTHQAIIIECGEFEGMSSPERLTVPLRPEGEPQLEETIQ